jgi:TraG P-loop domain
MSRRHTNESEPQPGAAALPETGELLAVEGIDRNGLVITSEGALVRILHVIPPNPLTMSAEGRERISTAFCRVVSRLRVNQSVQFYVEARPINLARLLLSAREEVAAWAGEPPSSEHPARDPLALSRWRLYAAMEETLALHAGDQAAVQCNAYVVIPYVPSQNSRRAVLNALTPRKWKLPVAPLERNLREHRRAARESLAHADAIRSELDALSLPTRFLNGEEVAALLWSRFNPTTADAHRRRPRLGSEIMGEFGTPVEREEARAAAVRLREAIARASLDFRRAKHYAEVEHDAEQTIYAATTANATTMGWLLNAMLTWQPFTLSVYAHALDRGQEHRKLKMSYRRVFAVNRSAEAKGRVPDFDRYSKEHEAEALLQEMSGQEQANLFRVSIYQSLRAPGPEPDLQELSEAVDYCTDQIEAMSDCRVNRGEFQQFELWQSTLPLGRDIAGRTRRYATRNVGDTVPLIGTSCGSPSGIPFAFSDPGRTLELLDPYDRTHSNFTMLVNGRSGSGKTMAANVLVSRCVAHGARGFVLDRAGHYTILTQLIDGARQVEIGADNSPYAVNPWDVPDPGEVSLEKIAFLVSLHGVMMGDEGLTTLERAQIGAAIRAVYARANHTGASPTESMLRDELLRRSREEQGQGAIDVAAVLRNLAERLGEFCGEGSYAYLLDRETTVPADSPLVVFDTRRCPDVVLRPVMFALLEYITRAIERHRDEFRSLTATANAPMFAGRTVLLIDEAWHLVGRRETGEYANDLARRARHLGLFLIVLSQHLSDFSTEHGLALIRNSTMQLLLNQHPDEIPFVREALSLSDEEASMIARLQTVKGSYSQMYFVNGTRGRGRVALRVGPTEYWCFTSDPLRDVPMRDAEIERNGGDIWAAVTSLAQGQDVTDPAIVAGQGGT